MSQAQDLCPEAGRQRWRKNNQGRFAQSHLNSVTQNASYSPGSKTLGWLVGLDGPHEGEDFRLTSGETVVGSGWEADVVLTTPEVSRTHARISAAPESVRIVDLESASGVFVNGQKELDALLKAGDVLRLGASSFQFVAAEKGAYINTQAPASSSSRSLERGVWGWLLITKGKNEGDDFRLIQGENRVGSESESEIRVSVPGADGQICVLLCVGAKCSLRRKSTALPVLVNRAPVDSCVLKDGDDIVMGALEFRVRVYG